MVFTRCVNVVDETIVLSPQAIAGDMLATASSAHPASLEGEELLFLLVDFGVSFSFLLNDIIRIFSRRSCADRGAILV